MLRIIADPFLPEMTALTLKFLILLLTQPSTKAKQGSLQSCSPILSLPHSILNLISEDGYLIENLIRKSHRKTHLHGDISELRHYCSQ